VEGVGVTGLVTIGAGVAGMVESGGIVFVDVAPLRGDECCTVLTLISKAPSTPAIETMTETTSITAMILAMWFFCDIL